jgi:type II secretory pathway component GspD/PulD (secretin)
MKSRTRGYIDALLIVLALGLLGCEELADQAEGVKVKAEVSSIREMPSEQIVEIPEGIETDDFSESAVQNEFDYIDEGFTAETEEDYGFADSENIKTSMASIMQVERVSSEVEESENAESESNEMSSDEGILVMAEEDSGEPDGLSSAQAEVISIVPEEAIPAVKIVPDDIAEADKTQVSELEIIGVREADANETAAMAVPEIVASEITEQESGEQQVVVQNVKIIKDNEEYEATTEIKPVVTVIAGEAVSIDRKSKVEESSVGVPAYVDNNTQEESIVLNAPEAVESEYSADGKRSFFGLLRGKRRASSVEVLADGRDLEDKPFDTSTALIEEDESAPELEKGLEAVSANNDSSDEKLLQGRTIELADAGRAVLTDQKPEVKDTGKPDHVNTMADKELQRLMVRRQMKQLQAERKLIKGRKLFDSQQYEAALRLFKEAESLDPESEKVQDSIRMTRDLIDGAGVRSREQLADKVMKQAVAREQYSAIQIKRLMDMGEKLLDEIKKGTIDTAGMDKADLLSLNKGKVEDALDSISKVDLLLHGEVGGGVSRADIRARSEALSSELNKEQERINAELEAISRTETLRSARETASRADETLKRQVNDLMKSAKYYFELDNFAKTMAITEEVLRLDPNYTPAVSLHDQARNYEHDRRYAKAGKDLQQAEDEWILDVEEMAIPNSTIVTYPEDWEDIKLRAKRASLDTTREAWKQRMQEKLDTIKITMDFDNLPLRSVIQYIEDQSQINIVMDKTVEPDAPVTLNVRDMTLGKALDWILKLTEQRYYHEMRDEALYISSSPKSEIYMKLYPVYDLTHSPRDYNGPQVDTTLEVGEGGEDGDLGEGLFGDDDDDDDEELDEEDGTIIENITKHIAPESWESEENAGKISINMWQDNLLVLQTASVHAQIADYLNNLRSSKKQQILVGTRFLNISEDFLEDIGVRWQDQNAAGTSAFDNNFTTGGPQTPGIGIGNWAERNSASGGDFGRYGKTYSAGMQIVPGVGAANYLNDGGIKMDMKYLSRQVLNDFEINAVLEAVRQNKKGSILHNPKLIVANGRNAFMEVRSQTNYVAGYEVVNGAFEPQAEAYSQGVVFDVKPVISFDKKYITVRMRPAMSTFIASRTVPLTVTTVLGGGGGGNVGVIQNSTYPLQLPQLALTRIWTYATVPNGGSVMLGGLIKDRRTEQNSSVPLISNLPVVGRLTKSNSKVRVKENLLLIVTAKIIQLDQ